MRLQIFAAPAPSLQAAELVHNFQVALGTIVNRLHTIRTEQGVDQLDSSFMVSFARKHRQALRAFAESCGPACQNWWGTVDDLLDLDTSE